MPHRVVLAAYNAAGERVKLLYEGVAQYLPGELNLNADTFIGGGGSLIISFPGVLAGGRNQVLWDGYNDSAMLVDGGVYVIKAEITDPFGEVTALIRTVQVLPGGVQQSVRIYNAAGELVRLIILPAVPGASRLELLGDSFGLELDPVTGQAVQPFKIGVVGNGGTVYTSWDGLNSLGAPVASGTYNLQLVSNEGGRTTVVESRSLSVLKAPESSRLLDQAQLGPNPLVGGGRVQLFYDPALLSANESVVAQVYNLAGELVAMAEDPARLGRVSLGLDRSAAGIYLVRCQHRRGQALLRTRTFKLALLR
jgi:flagellar hook assembly protein FlgD